MATTRSRPAPARRPPAKATNARSRQAAPEPKDETSSLSSLAEKVPTDYHKVFARWLVTEVGYDPDSASSKRAAFLRGVSLGVSARPAFMNSDFLEAWRESTGQAKRGPKPKEEDASPTRTRRAKAQPEPEVDDGDDDEDDFDDEEAVDDEDSDDDFDDEDSDDDDDADDFDDEPAPRRGRPAAKKAAPGKRAPAKKAAPAARRSKATADDDEFLF